MCAVTKTPIQPSPISKGFLFLPRHTYAVMLQNAYPKAITNVHGHVMKKPRLIFPDWDRSNEQQPASSTSAGQHKKILVMTSLFHHLLVSTRRHS